MRRQSKLHSRHNRNDGRFRFDTVSLRGIKDSPPYLHDGRLMTLEDSVEFFNLIEADTRGKTGPDRLSALPLSDVRARTAPAVRHRSTALT